MYILVQSCLHLNIECDSPIFINIFILLERQSRIDYIDIRIKNNNMSAFWSFFFSFVISSKICKNYPVDTEFTYVIKVQLMNLIFSYNLHVIYILFNSHIKIYICHYLPSIKMGDTITFTLDVDNNK